MSQPPDPTKADAAVSQVVTPAEQPLPETSAALGTAFTETLWEIADDSPRGKRQQLLQLVASNQEDNRQQLVQERAEVRRLRDQLDRTRDELSGSKSEASVLRQQIKTDGESRSYRGLLSILGGVLLGLSTSIYDAGRGDWATALVIAVVGVVLSVVSYPGLIGKEAK